jgi:hypothetical protein
MPYLSRIGTCMCALARCVQTWPLARSPGSGGGMSSCTYPRIGWRVEVAPGVGGAPAGGPQGRAVGVEERMVAGVEVTRVS